MTSLELKKAFGNAKQGDRIVYYVGHIMFDRQLSRTADKSESVDRLAEAAWRLAGMKWVANARPAAAEGHQGQWLCVGDKRGYLVQRKLAEPLGYEYQIVKL